MKSVLVVVALACSAGIVAADPGGNANVPAAQRRANIKHRIQALRAAEITTDLNLDSDAAAKLTATLNKYDDETDALVQQRVELARKLQNAGPNTSTKDAERMIDDAVANAKAFRDLEDRRFGEIRKLLTPQQTAKLLVVLPEFERKIQNQLKNAIQNANAPANQGQGHNLGQHPQPRQDVDDRE
jgi:hypothetical protein